MIANVELTGEERADRVCRFVGGLTLSGSYAGEPFVLRPWQEAILRPLFGTLNLDGTRQYRECGIWLPRKNAKTELAAAIAAHELFCSPIEGEIYTAAAEREQAAIIYSKVAGMIRRNPKLAKRVKLIDSQRRIINQRTGTLFWSLSSDAKSKHGFNPSLVIGDEIHCWPKRDLWTALTTGSDTRPEPLFITITTAGNYDKASLEFELWEYARKVRDGIIEDKTYLPIIYEIQEHEDWLDEQVWHRINPALGDFRSLTSMRDLAVKAQQIPRLENDFRRLYLNQHTSQTTRWLRMSDWAATISEAEFDPTRPVFGGLDLASTRDLTAWCLVQKTDTGGYRVRWKFWIPRHRMTEIERDDRVPYWHWHRQGWIDTAGLQAIDYAAIEEQIRLDSERWDLQYVGYDPWNALATVQRLERHGVEMVKVQQGLALSSPCKELERVLTEGTLEHLDDPVAEWCATNAEVKEIGGNLRLQRPQIQASNRKIDGISALCTALAVAMAAKERRSSYDAGPLVATGTQCHDKQNHPSCAETRRCDKGGSVAEERSCMKSSGTACSLPGYAQSALGHGFGVARVRRLSQSARCYSLGG